MKTGKRKTVHPLSPPETGGVPKGRGWIRTESVKLKSENYPPPPSLCALPSVAMGIATLRGHRMTSSHSSKDPLRPPVSGGQSKSKTSNGTHSSRDVACCVRKKDTTEYHADAARSVPTGETGIPVIIANIPFHLLKQTT